MHDRNKIFKSINTFLTSFFIYLRIIGSEFNDFRKQNLKLKINKKIIIWSTVRLPSRLKTVAVLEFSQNIYEKTTKINKNLVI